MESISAHTFAVPHQHTNLPTICCMIFADQLDSLIENLLFSFRAFEAIMNIAHVYSNNSIVFIISLGQNLNQ
jgi:hypothetical protein